MLMFILQEGFTYYMNGSAVLDCSTFSFHGSYAAWLGISIKMQHVQHASPKISRCNRCLIIQHCFWQHYQTTF